jgi:glyoxylase-like metal-dependent hydrolase (beta-lactamase superfamily II)
MKIADGIYSIGQTGKMAYLSGDSHAYLLDDGRELTLIDTLADSDAGLIFEELQKIKRPVSDLKYILLTHGHMSHLGGLATLKRASGAIVCSHAWEADIIAGNRTIQSVPLSPTPPLSLLPQRMGLALGVSAAAAWTVDQPLKGGEDIGPVRVIHTPGHTPGHLAFYWPARKALFTGDKVSRGHASRQAGLDLTLTKGSFNTLFYEWLRSFILVFRFWEYPMVNRS